MEAAPFFTRVGIIGTGLIGSSFALALKERKLAGEIWGYSRSGTSSDMALDLGIIDRKAVTLAEIGSSCDLIMVAVPVLSTMKVLEELAPSVPPGAIVTDAGSVKSFSADAHRLFPQASFVGGHPIAGTEKSGPESAFGSLFEGAWCVLTPVDGTDPVRLSRVAALWAAVGMKLITLTPDEHDRAMAFISHLPHIVAFGLVATASPERAGDLPLTAIAGGGYRDFTRIARSDAVMWADICTLNRRALLDAIDAYSRSLSRLRDAVASGSREAVMSELLRIKSPECGRRN